MPAQESVVRLTDRPDMTLDVYRGRKTTMQCNATVNFSCLLHNSDIQDSRYFHETWYNYKSLSNDVQRTRPKLHLHFVRLYGPLKFFL